MQHPVQQTTDGDVQVVHRGGQLFPQRVLGKRLHHPPKFVAGTQEGCLRGKLREQGLTFNEAVDYRERVALVQQLLIRFPNPDVFPLARSAIFCEEGIPAHRVDGDRNPVAEYHQVCLCIREHLGIIPVGPEQQDPFAEAALKDVAVIVGHIPHNKDEAVGMKVFPDGQELCADDRPNAVVFDCDLKDAANDLFFGPHDDCLRCAGFQTVFPR